MCQTETFSNAQKHCSCCSHNRRVKSYHLIQFRTLFGIVAIPGLRLYHCACDDVSAKTFSPLVQLLPEHTSPELQYLETKWASLMSYGLTIRTREQNRLCSRYFANELTIFCERISEYFFELTVFCE